MRNLQHENIEAYHQKFLSLKLYEHRLLFFDTYFGILPFDFPPFDPALGILFVPEMTTRIIELNEKERKGGNLLSERFMVNKMTYDFDIIPETTNRQFLNDFILSKFLKGYESVFLSIKKSKFSAEKQITSLIFQVQL